MISALAKSFIVFSFVNTLCLEPSITAEASPDGGFCEEDGGYCGKSKENLDDLIPTIRLDDPDKLRTAQALRDACINAGFFYLEGHGIPQSQLDEVVAASAEFFNLPSWSKEELWEDPDIPRHGYITRKDGSRELLFFGEDVPKDSPEFSPRRMLGPNKWPTPTTCPDMKDCEAFRRTITTYQEEIEKVAFRLTQLLFLSLGLEETEMGSLFDPPMTQLRLNSYDNVEDPEDYDIWHTDLRMLTLLLTDEIRALQIQTVDEEWIYVPPRKGAFVGACITCSETEWRNLHLFSAYSSYTFPVNFFSHVACYL